LLEEFWKGDGGGKGAAEVVLEVVDASGIWTEAGEKGGARRAADGLLAIGFGKYGTAPGEGIDIRRVDVFGAITTELWAEVIYSDEQDVHFRCCGSEARGDQGA